MSRARTTLAVCSSAMAAMASCGPDVGATGPDFDGFQPCAVVSDCDTGEVCSSRYGFCFKPMPADTPIVVAVEPPPGSATVPDQFNNAPCIEPGRLNLTVTPRTTLVGKVIPPSGTGAAAYRGAGRLFAEAEGRIPGFSFRHEAATSAGSTGSAFEIQMAPDRDYQLTFVPNDTSVPPATWTVEAGISGTLDLQVNAPVFEFSGVVRRMSEQDRVPVPGAVVQAIVGGRTTTSSVTDMNGVFALAIPETAGQVTLQALPADAGPVFVPKSLQWDSVQDFKADLPLTGFMAFDIDPVPDVATISLQVLSIVMAGGRIPMAGSSVFLERTGADGAFSVRTAVDGNGFCTLSVPSGDYSIAVLPPGGGADMSLKSRHFASRQRSATFNADDTRTFGVELDPRPTMAGRVVSAEDAGPVAGARVVLAADTLMIEGWTSSFKSDISFEAVTDANGEFSMPIEPGTWAMQVRPSVGTGLGAASWPAIQVTGTEYLRVELGRTCLLGGRIVASTGEALDGATLTFFQPTTRQTWEAWPMKDDSWANSIRATGMTRTGADGMWEILLPCPDSPASTTGGIVQDW